MKSVCASVVILAIFLTAQTIGGQITPVAAIDALTADDLLKLCNGSRDEQAKCDGYIAGAEDMLINFSIFGTTVCPTAPIEPRTTREIAVRWIKSRGDGSRLLAAQAVLDALRDAFPCQE